MKLLVPDLRESWYAVLLQVCCARIVEWEEALYDAALEIAEIVGPGDIVGLG